MIRCFRNPSRTTNNLSKVKTSEINKSSKPNVIEQSEIFQQLNKKEYSLQELFKKNEEISLER
jgi:hypothetical protein